MWLMGVMGMNKHYDIEDVVMSLVGPVHPAGETHTDERRYKSLGELCDLHDRITQTLIAVAQIDHRDRHSMKQLVEYAEAQLDERMKDIQRALSDD